MEWEYELEQRIVGATGQGRSDGIEMLYQFANAGGRVIYDEIRGADGSFNDVDAHSRSLLAAGAYSFGPVRVYAGYQHLSAPKMHRHDARAPRSAPESLNDSTSFANFPASSCMRRDSSPA